MIKNLFVACCLTALFNCTALAENTDYTEPTTGMEFVLVMGETYMMGDSSGQDKDASPSHEVTIGNFFMGKNEVTFEQYDLFCEEDSRAKPDDAGWGRGNRPVINVDWHDGVAFTEWLSKKSGRVLRLPTEAEWEYAARGGTATVYWWGDVWQDQMGVCQKCGTEWDGRMTAPVGTFQPNPYGLHDMTGNVYEWCLDHKHDTYDGAPSTAEPWTEGGQPGLRISRGGSWRDDIREFRPSARCWDKVDYKYTDTGFRVLLEP